MKIKLLISIVLLTLVGVQVVAAQKDESTATLQETMEWIKSKLENYSGFYPNPDGRSVVMVQKIDGCKITFNSSLWLDKGIALYEIVNEISLNKADPFGVTYQNEGFGELKINGASGRTIGKATFYVSYRKQKNDPPVVQDVSGDYEYTRQGFRPAG